MSTLVLKIAIHSQLAPSLGPDVRPHHEERARQHTNFHVMAKEAKGEEEVRFPRPPSRAHPNNLKTFHKGSWIKALTASQYHTLGSTL